MDDIDLDKEDRNGKRSMINEEDLTVVPSKRPNEKEEIFRTNEISKHEKLFSGMEISKARQRWNLLSYHLRCSNKKRIRDITTDVQATFIVFEASFIPKYSNVGRWYHLKSPFGDIEFDIHIYSAVTITPSVLTGFNNSGNIRVWPSEECLAYYLLRHGSLVQNKTVLELGSGMVGLSGLTSAALGASEVVLTDGNEKSVENIHRIIEMNMLSSYVTCCVLSWNIPIPNKQFDVILCADCLFFTEEHRALLNCTYQHLKPGGIAYITAPDRNGTARTFLDLVYKERKRWQSVNINFHIENEAEIYSKLKMQNSQEVNFSLLLKHPLQHCREEIFIAFHILYYIDVVVQQLIFFITPKIETANSYPPYIWQSDKIEIYQEVVDAIHYSCMLIQDEVIEELMKKGQKIEFDKEVIAQVAFAICDTLCGVWPSELLQFAKHARRSVVNISDLTLLFRRNESILSLIRNIVESLLLPVRKRQCRKDTNKKNTRTTKSIEMMDSENSKGVNNLLFEKNNLKLGDFWNQPSVSRDRSLPSSETLKSTTMEEKYLPDSISLQRKKVAAKKKEMPFYCKQETHTITESRKVDKSRKGRSQTSKQWLQTLFHLNSSESEEEQELEFLDNNISVPCYSDKKNLREQKPHFVTGFISRGNEEIREINDLNISNFTVNLSKEVKMHEKNPTVSLLKLDNEILIEKSTTVIANYETAPHIQSNKSNRNKIEFQIENLPDGNSISCSETSVLNSTRRIHRLCAADDCFSSFKFESDGEDSDQSLSLLENKATSNKNSVSPPINSNRYFGNKCASMNNNQEQRLNVTIEESDVDLDATVFDF